jgi:soluble lytic murein transglycosylase-like protein
MGIIIGLIVGVVAGLLVIQLSKKKTDTPFSGEIPEGQKVLDVLSGKKNLVYDKLPPMPSQFDETGNAVFISNNILKPFGVLIEKYCNKYNLSPAIVSALIYVESTGHPEIQSANKRSVGLMQLERGAVNDYEQSVGGSYDVNALKIPETNIKIGTWYLRHLIDTAVRSGIVERVTQIDLKETNQFTMRYKDNSELYHALRAYNGGQGRVFANLIGVTGEFRDGLGVSIDYANKIYVNAWALAYWHWRNLDRAEQGNISFFRG